LWPVPIGLGKYNEQTWPKNEKSGKGNAKGLNMNGGKWKSHIFSDAMSKAVDEKQLPCKGSGSQRTPPVFFFRNICVQSVQVKEHHSLMNCFR